MQEEARRSRKEEAGRSLGGSAVTTAQEREPQAWRRRRKCGEERMEMGGKLRTEQKLMQFQGRRRNKKAGRRMSERKRGGEGIV
jgi:hypothetical protein